MRFIGRQHELDFLNQCYESSKAQLVFLYGRRRVGKTETLFEFARNKRHVFFAAPEATRAEQLSLFSRRLFEAGAPAGKYLSRFDTWHDAISEVTSLPGDGRKLVIIDEFPYLVKADPSLPSILQNLWDAVLRNENLMIVLCGSAMSSIENELLAEKNPLYGRATGILKMEPMDYRTAAEFFPRFSPADQVTAFSILGGIPHYLAQFDDGFSIEENIKRRVLTKGCTLYSEIEFLLHQELRETAVYNGIIHAVAMGASALGEIAARSMVPSQKASVYLKNLIELGIIKREFSIADSPKETSKSTRGIYRMADAFFRFWYAFIFPNKSDLEMLDVDGVYRFDVEPELTSFSSLTFEDVCRTWLRRQNQRGELATRFGEIGRYWNKQVEIDVASFSKAAGMRRKGLTALVGECKFGNSPLGESVLESLDCKAASLHSDEVERFLFARSGFSAPLMRRAELEANLHLVGIDELYD
ncbi:ATP-binding protein [Arabiibacter massiliensis]|uniref:ATP-binding protein n=1 Tax=Arabiibacter massiliensis TaxID=1870985 RepID=UPI0009BBBB90|nr:ATP-binding protein [Arabiibacter massiliensis]